MSDDPYLRLRQAGWHPEQLAERSILVAGCGALGSEAACHLAAAGVGRLVLVDHDRVERHNLTRSFLLAGADEDVLGRPKVTVAARNLHRLNPRVTVEPLEQDLLTLGLGYYQEADLVLGCVDSVEGRLEINRRCWQMDRPWLDGGLGPDLGACAWYRPQEDECYECTLSPRQWEDLRRSFSCGQLRLRVPPPVIPTLSPVASVTAAIQAHWALLLLQGLPVPNVRKLFYLPALASTRSIDSYGVPSEGCASHAGRGRISGNVVPTALTCRSLVADVFRLFPDSVIRLRDEFVESASCPNCSRRDRILQHRSRVYTDDVHCCGEPMELQTVTALQQGSRDGQTLSQMGIADHDLLEVENSNGTRWLGLRPS